MLETITKRFSVADFAARAYVAEAKKIMLADNGLTLEELKAQSYAVYMASIREALDRGDVSAAINARSRIDRLFGLVKPVNNFINGKLQSPSS